MRKHLQRFGNLFVIRLLRSPLHPLASRSLVLISYHGVRSGRRFTIPVMYAEHEGALTIFVGASERKRWWRNLRAGAVVDVRLRGRCMRGQAQVVHDRAALENYVRRYPRTHRAIQAADSPTFVRITALTPHH
jgi:deazaflavin-dependent oxidoreductase (nitroreductase family)